MRVKANRGHLLLFVSCYLQLNVRGIRKKNHKKYAKRNYLNGCIFYVHVTFTCWWLRRKKNLKNYERGRSLLYIKKYSRLIHLSLIVAVAASASE